ncbi:PREDICTED: uncharacterized protein LOC109470951 [Branchiostoma belcheri]|uniref:Neuroendocrine protein 7B2 n=1 Tax=Branchiostoma belcheri TaxID=7741 RepID=A0A6P4YV27_BRABE|nr:PREDICTED: uncharacterized protein LOC109470951 [Branchiostoma belcheri]
MNADKASHLAAVTGLYRSDVTRLLSAAEGRVAANVYVRYMWTAHRLTRAHVEMSFFDQKAESVPDAGGASEGVQHLGPAGNIPNLWAAMVESDNNRKPDAYPNPPNPCPKGYTAEDGCIEDMPDTADFSRLYQAREEALRGGQEEGAPYSSPRGPGGAPYGNELNELEYYLNPYRAGEKREAVVAKKSPLYLRRRRSLGLSSAVAMETDEREDNPFFKGEKLRHVAAKKSPELSRQKRY